MDRNQTILLGLSGGPDSMLLYTMMAHLHQKGTLKLEVVHIDHQVRPESKEEAKELQRLALESGVPFHLKQITPSKKNFEDSAREKRYQCFKRIAEETGAQAIVLGHHADDQAETVLKRCFEGGLLSSLGVLKPVNFLYGIKTLRPLLQFSKGEIQKALEEEKIPYFNDPTNFDGSNLRSKFRIDIIPLLKEKFGKNISKGLTHLADDILEFNAYMEHRITGYKIIVTEAGAELDLSVKCPEAHLELKYLLRRLCKEVGITPSRESIDVAVNLIKSNSVNKKIDFNKGVMKISQKKICLNLC